MSGNRKGDTEKLVLVPRLQKIIAGKQINDKSFTVFPLPYFFCKKKADGWNMEIPLDVYFQS